jgi:hypothetical protein
MLINWKWSRWVKNADINHPIGNLAHAQTSGIAKLLFFFLAWVWMIRVTMQPGL